MQLFHTCFDTRSQSYLLFSFQPLEQFPLDIPCCFHVVFKISSTKTEAVLRLWKETVLSPNDFQSHVINVPFGFFLLPFSFRKTIHNAVPCLRFLIRISKNDLLRGSINESSFRTSLSSHQTLAGRTKSTCVSSVSTGEAVSLSLFPWRTASIMFLWLPR